MGVPRSFIALWTAQFISLVATDMTKFALRIWTYESTGSVTQFALITFFAEMPSILISPFSGAVVDKYDRKKVMMIADTLAAVSTLCVWFLLVNNALTSWHLYAANAFASVMNSFQWPAFIASVTLLIPKDDLVKFGSLSQFAPALSMLMGPAFTGVLMKFVGLQGVFVIEVASFIIAMYVTNAAQIPSAASTETKQQNLWQAVKAALAFIASRPALLALLFFQASGLFAVGMIQVLMTPLILSFSDATALGLTLTASGTGAIFGNSALSLWGGPKRRVLAVLSCALFQGLLLASTAFAGNAISVLLIAFIYMGTVPLVRVCREAIWQCKTPSSMLGRVFAIQKMISQLSLPLAAVAAGPLADYVFEPAFATPHSSSAAGFLGAFIGTGKGRGVAALFAALGVTNATCALLGLLYRPLRRVDIDLPDLIQTDETLKKSK